MKRLKGTDYSEWKQYIQTGFKLSHFLSPSFVLRENTSKHDIAGANQALSVAESSFTIFNAKVKNV